MYSEPKKSIELKENFTLRSDDITLSSWMVRLFSWEYSSSLVHSKRGTKVVLGNDQVRSSPKTILSRFWLDNTTEDWTSNLYTPTSQSLFGKREFYRLKYITIYFETAHAYAFWIWTGLLTVRPGSSSSVNQNTQTKIFKRCKETR